MSVRALLLQLGRVSLLLHLLYSLGAMFLAHCAPLPVHPREASSISQSSSSPAIEAGVLVTRTSCLGVLGARSNGAANPRQPKRVGDSGMAASSLGSESRPIRHSDSTGILREPYEALLVPHNARYRLNRQQLAELELLLPARLPSGSRKKSGTEVSSMREEGTNFGQDKSLFLTWEEVDVLKTKLKNAKYRSRGKKGTA